MASVKSISTYSDRAWGDVQKRRYSVVLTDLLGNDHAQVIGVFKVDATDDGTTQANALLSSKKNDEVEQYKESIRDGVNPFVNTALWNTRVELLIPILTESLSQPATDSIVYNGLPYLALVTDDELIALFSKDQAWVDNVRVQAANLLSGKATLDSYVPVLGAV